MTRIIKIIFLFFFIALLWHSYALSKEKPSEETLITLYVGEIKIISVDIPNRIAVTNPEVADVNTASNSELVIMAQAPGTTSVIWWDSLGQHALQLQVFAENMKIIEQRV
ncbi:MAG: pilus assembly protein N-terminal domain-containing protein, partial [Candidatus Omnitrophota bacterium]